MKDQFVPYELALALKELGFNEPCFTSFDDKQRLRNPFDCKEDYINNVSFIENSTCFCKTSELSNGFIAAPLWQQAFDWFRDKHYLPSCLLPYISTKKDWEEELIYIPKIYTLEGTLTLEMGVYEEARLACLVKLIEIVKSKK